MKYIIYGLVIALTWAHIGPHIYLYNQYRVLKATIPECTLDLQWSWYHLRFAMGANDCVQITTN